MYAVWTERRYCRKTAMIGSSFDCSWHSRSPQRRWSTQMAELSSLSNQVFLSPQLDMRQAVASLIIKSKAKSKALASVALTQSCL